MNGKKICSRTGKPIRWCRCGQHIKARLMAKRRRAASRAHRYRRGSMISWQYNIPEVPANEAQQEDRLLTEANSP